MTSELDKHLRRCRLCPRRCGARRASGEVGPCGAGATVRLASAVKHVGEEPPISGARGSGTFFFSHCPLACCFCQNFPISQLGHGTDISIADMASKMRRMERRGAHNINFVTGTQFAPHIIEAVRIARTEGVTVPIVWNTSGYETPETIELLDGTVDIYLTDIKYCDDRTAARLSDAPGYFDIATRAAEAMFAQVGSLRLDAAGVATRGVIVRHMVLPGGLAGTETVMRYVHRTFGDAVPVSLMGQYFPAHRARAFPEIAHPLTDEMYASARAATLAAGIKEGWFQEMNDPEIPRGA